MVHVRKYTIHGWYGIGKKNGGLSQVMWFFSGSILVFRGRYLLTRPFRGTSKPGGSCARPTSLRIAAHQRCRGVSEVGHLIINGSIYVVLCHVFFCRGVIRLPNFCWRGIKLDATLWRFFEKSENSCSVLVVNKSIDPCFGLLLLLLRPLSWWWILYGHEHLCIPTSEVTSRMKRDLASQAVHSRSRRIFFHIFVLPSQRYGFKRLRTDTLQQQIAGILWRICSYGPVSIDSHRIFEKQPFHDC